MNSILKPNKLTDAEEIMCFIERLREKSGLLTSSATDKLSCVIQEHPENEMCGTSPAPCMSPIFYDMYGVLSDIESYVDSTQKTINNAELPVRYGQAIEADRTQ
jgi:hypothetical protein